MQASVKINETMYTMGKSSDGKRSQVWIAVSSANDISSNFFNKKAEDITPGTIYTIDRSGEVDLGIPGILWADHNLGGTNPWDYGDYYAWGEIYPNYADGHAYDDPVTNWRTKNGREFEKYNWVTYSDFDGWGSGSDFWYYTIGGKKQLANEDDAAYCDNNKQSIPTPDDFTQLKTKCFWVWTDQYGGQTFNNKNSSGYIIYAAKKAKFAGYVAYDMKKVSEGTVPPPKDFKNYSTNFNWEKDTHIFLPAPGFRYGDRLNQDGQLCHYWTSMLDPDETTSKNAINLYFTNYEIGQRGDIRCNGFSIRPVRHCPIN